MRKKGRKSKKGKWKAEVKIYTEVRGNKDKKGAKSKN
jgi:hypothetical protein